MKSKLTILFLFLSVALQSALSQFVELQYDVLAGSEVKTYGSNKPANFGESLQWLGVSVEENIELIVGISYRTLPDGVKPSPALYLNNGTFNISGAVPLESEHAVLAINNGSIPAQNGAGVPSNLTASLGQAFSASENLNSGAKYYQSSGSSAMGGGKGIELSGLKQDGRLLRQKNSTSNSLTFWIGLRPSQTKEVTIEYN